MCELRSKLTVMTLFGFHSHRSGVFIVNSEYISRLFSTADDSEQVNVCRVKFYLVSTLLRTASLQEDMDSSP